MRLAPALGTCWLATVAVLVGCSTWTAVPKAAQVLSARAAPSPAKTADTASAVSAPARSRKPQVHVPHIDESSIARSPKDAAIGPGSMSAQIEREIARMRSEWDARRRDMNTVRPEIPKDRATEPQTVDPKPNDRQVTGAMLAVERKYAPKFLNCRMRIRRLESLLTDASGPARDSLLRKLEQARADLDSLDAECSKELELARLDAGPAVVEKDGEADSDVSAGTDIYPNSKAGGGAD